MPSGFIFSVCVCVCVFGRLTKCMLNVNLTLSQTCCLSGTGVCIMWYDYHNLIDLKPNHHFVSIPSKVSTKVSEYLASPEWAKHLKDNHDISLDAGYVTLNLSQASKQRPRSQRTKLAEEKIVLQDPTSPVHEVVIAPATGMSTTNDALMN
eukprot:GHVU01013424.1.p1 GENE.GHVU01013424.1~~GHVU01013424.1.p1  ORF type:complete len:168 (-),score=10.22 GHVU01013424.1:456-908(-)